MSARRSATTSTSRAGDPEDGTAPPASGGAGRRGATVDDTRARLAEKMARPAPAQFLVIERDGAAIGAAGHSGGGEIGYILHRAHWRQGFAHEALSAFIPYLFGILDVPALKAEVDPENLASVILLSRLGFRVTGYSRDYYLLEDRPCDSVYLRLPRPGAAASV
nr:GNAT family N-acetyltransferase [Histidinibacterium lentulum]